MMPIKFRNTILIWFGGVITELIPKLTLQMLGLEPNGRDFIQQRSEIHSLAEKLSLGVMSARAYCAAAINITHSNFEIDTLEVLIQGRASLNQPVMDVLDPIPAKYEKWLISDYPESWFREIALRTNLTSQFPADRTIFTSQSDLYKMVPMNFEFISRASGHPLDECVLIDSLSSRAVQAVRGGLSAIIYVYPEKLEHELALRGLLETELEVLHPQTSIRVKMG